MMISARKPYSHILFLGILLLFGACVPEHDTSAANCEPGFTYSIANRRCEGSALGPGVTNAPPFGTFGSLTLQEDTDQVLGVVIELTYGDSENDLAVSCNVTGEVHVREIGGCSCIGGVCTTRITTLTPNYSGPAEFFYTISDSFGTSTPRLVPVTITPTDDPPSLPLVSFTPLIFNEDTIPQPINLSFFFTDIDGGNGTETCIISNVQGGISSPVCTCVAGNCNVSYIQDANYHGPTGFDAQVHNGLFSNIVTVPLTILPIDDSPNISLASFTPLVFNEDDPPISIDFCFSDIDGYPGPNVCTVSNSTIGISSTSCTCDAAPSPACTGINGTSCTIQTTLDPDFNGVVTFDVDVDNGLPSTTVTQAITIASINDSPSFDTNVPSLNFYTLGFNPGDENTLLETVPFQVNEEGLPPPLISYEDNQPLSLRVSSSDPSIVPNLGSNIKILWDENGTNNFLDLSYDGINPIVLPQSVNNVHEGQVKLQFIPARHRATGPRTGPTTPVVMTLEINDGDVINNFATQTFNVDFLNINNPPTITTTSQTSVGTWCQYSLALDSSSCPASGCFDLTLPPTLNGALPTSPPDGLVYYEADAGACYYSDNNSWISFPTNCPVTPRLEYPQCDGSGISCISDGPPTTTNAPIDTFYFDSADSTCYRSDGTNWEVFQAIPDISANEKDVLVVRDLHFDEGDRITNTSDEVAQELQITITSSNQVLIPNANINLRKSGLEVVPLGTAVTNYTLEPGTVDDFLAFWQIEMLPVSGQVGTSTITVSISESNTVSPEGPLVTSTTFEATVNPVSAIHGGWANVKSVGGKVEEFNSSLTNQLDNAEITIEWNPFTMVGSGQGVGVGIAGWNIYRSTISQNYNFENPLNGTLIPATTLSYTDTFNASESASTSGQRYFYVVRPVDSVFNLPTATSQDTPFRELTVVRPPRNMVFVHRWMANQETCQKIFSDTDPANNYRCPYEGPGEVDDGGTTYYDIGSHYLMDRFEVGCNFESGSEPVTCTDNDGCIGLSGPTDTIVDGKLYYDRSTATCFLRSGGSWVEANNLANISSGGDNLQFDRSNFANLPPLVNISQENAFKFCQARTPVTVSGIGISSQMRIPTRKEQVAFSAWSAELSDPAINELETGISLNSSAKCNSSEASGLENQYENSGFPGTGNIFTLPATFDSDIRTLATGSAQTDLCVSRFGAQDLIGNVDEWAIDRFYCKNEYECEGIRQGGNESVCNFTTTAGACAPFSACIEDEDPTTIAGGLTPAAIGDIFYNREANRCFVATGTASAADWNLLPPGPSTDDRFYFGGLPLAGDQVNDFEVADPNFDYYRLDSLRGPCNTGGTNFCDDEIITPFLFANQGLNSGRFSFPLGLPISNTFISNFPFISPSTNIISSFFLSIGTTAGITVSNLHGDGFEFNSQTIHNDVNQCGATSSGGSYKTGSRSGRFYMEVSQCSGAPRDDLGFRCVTRLP